MADGKKAEKLAAARQMLKKFQQTKETRIRKTPEPQLPGIPGDGPYDINANTEADSCIKHDDPLSNGNTFASDPVLLPDEDFRKSLRDEFPVQTDAGNSVSHFFRHSPVSDSKPELNFFDSIAVTNAVEKPIVDPSTTRNSGYGPSYPGSVQAPVSHIPPPGIPESASQPPRPQLYFSDHQTSTTSSQTTAAPSPPPQSVAAPVEAPRLAELQMMCEVAKNELSIEREKNIELQKQLKLAADRIGTLETEIKVVRLEKDNHLTNEISNLEDKLKIQLRTIEILVADKSELHRQVEQFQEENKTKTKEIEELSGRLRVSRSNVARLESEVSHLTDAARHHNTILKKLETSLQENNQQTDRYKQQLEESENEVKELKRRLDCSFVECSAIRRELEEKESQLSMAQIRMRQLGSGSTEGIEVTDSEECKTLREEIENMKLNIMELSSEKDQSANQYQQYINTLNSQLQDIASKYESLTVEKDELMAREESLVSHISELEKQMQKQSAAPAVVNSSELIEQNSKLKEEVENMTRTVQDLTAQLETKDEETEGVRLELAGEREKCAELESTVQELERNVPNATLLQAAIESDKLAASRAIQQNNQLKQELTDMREAFIRLSNNKVELMEELEHEQQSVAELREELNRWKQKSAMKSDESTQFGLGLVHKATDGCSQTTYHDIESMHSPDEPVSPEAMAMLEEKFRKTMNSLAELSDEKQRLEHLVLQLQGETETIGEYIALYQAQRSLLQQRACEKDQQVNAIAREKEILRKKLEEITKLVPQLVNSSESATEAVEGSPTEEKPAAAESNGVEESNGSTGVEGASKSTASKILSLISEIETSSLVQQDKAHTGHHGLNFHPCPLCSGRLITV